MRKVRKDFVFKKEGKEGKLRFLRSEGNGDPSLSAGRLCGLCKTEGLLARLKLIESEAF